MKSRSKAFFLHQLALYFGAKMPIFTPETRYKNPALPAKICWCCYWKEVQRQRVPTALEELTSTVEEEYAA